MRVQGYIEIDYQAMDAETFEAFNAFMRQYMVHYRRVHKDAREYYSCIIRDHSKIEDQVLDDGTIVPGLLTLLADRNPIINGLWQIDGTPFGQTKNIEIDPETGEQTVTISGDPTYSFNLDIHLNHTPTDKVYDEDGNIVSETIVSEYRPLHAFYGYVPGQEY